MKKPNYKKQLNWIKKYLRYTNYISAAQLYLKDNFFLDKELKLNHIKERILGHWGTVPGLNLIYANLNILVKNTNANILFIAGPGHGAPAVISNMFIEGSFNEYYKDLTVDKKGTSKLIKMFSWPKGFPSHTNPGTPGTILEGGELGYSLSTAYGAVMDNPDLIVACVVGDGESETGPLATSWQSNKYLNPKTSGAVLPILHANGYKITSPTIYASMSDKELTKYFEGLGYNPRIIHIKKRTDKEMIKMMKTFEWAYKEIKNIQQKARSSKKDLLKPKWPMLIVRSLKGATGIKHLHGHKIEGLYRSHGIPCHPRDGEEDFNKLKHWLESYKINELLNKDKTPKKELLEYIPKGKYRIGMNKHANPDKQLHKKLKLPKLEKYEVKPFKEQQRNTAVSSNYIRDIIKKNKNNFRFFCPDETESNKYTSLFEATQRAFMWPLQKFDENIGPEGRVMEVLSEHNLIGWLEGYLLTGRHGVFATYEAFAMIVASMVDQYAKFLKQNRQIKWRNDLASLNIILTSLGWRQEHNGYSHQNPGFISDIVEKHGELASVYFPADANALLVTLEDSFKRKNAINVIVATKQFMPQWLTLKQAREEIKTGIAIWDFLNKEDAKNPDVVFSASGDAMIQEAIASISILKKDIPELKTRFVNVSELTALGLGDERKPIQDQKTFEKYFTKDKPVIYNFHGYAGVIKNLLFNNKTAQRFKIHGYKEEGTTTTPVEMMVDF